MAEKKRPTPRSRATSPSSGIEEKSGESAKSSRAVTKKPGGSAAKPPSSEPREGSDGPTSKPAKQSMMAGRKTSSFGVGDQVVHPHHGAATIIRKTRQVVDGARKDYFELEIATDQLTVYVPVDKIDEAIRPVISQSQARKVFALFKEEPQEAGANWSRWYKVLNEKMTSGDIYQVAEVVRDLTYAQQTKGISPALKRMLSRARLTLSSELQFALDLSEEDAIKRLDRALPKVEAA